MPLEFFLVKLSPKVNFKYLYTSKVKNLIRKKECEKICCVSYKKVDLDPNTQKYAKIQYKIPNKVSKKSHFPIIKSIWLKCV